MSLGLSLRQKVGLPLLDGKHFHFELDPLFQLQGCLRLK